MQNLVPVKTIIKPVSESSRVEGQCWDILAQAQKLRRNGRFEGAIDEVRRGFKLAEKYYFNRLCAEFASYLHYYYYNVKQDKPRGRKYRKHLDKYLQLANIQDQAQAEFAEISMEWNQTRHPGKRLKERLEKTCAELSDHLEYQNPHISVYIYSLQVLDAYAKRDFVKVAGICKKAIELFDACGVNRQQYFYFFLVPSLILKGDRPAAGAAIQEALSRVRPGGYSWAVFHYYLVLNEFHSGHYDQAHEQLQRITRKKQVNRALGEQLKIAKGYLKFLAHCGQLSNPVNFRIGKFLNEVPVFTADKFGNYINILILRFLMDLVDNRGRLIDRFHAIERSANRYTERGSREQIFMRMLVRVPRYQFNVSAIELRSKEDLAALGRKGVDVNREVVPYEVLWGMVIGCIEKGIIH